jgi:hypothetical protein
MRAMSAAGSETAGGTTSSEGAPKVARWRRIACGVLVVIVCLLVPLSLLAVWTRNTLLDTDQYVDTVGPLAASSAIQQSLADTVVFQITQNVDVEGEIKDALPERAAFVAPFVAQGLEGFVRDATLRLLQTEQFQNLWNDANRRAHTQVVAVLTGNEDGRISTKDGKVVIRIGPIVEKVRERLSSLGVDIFSASASEGERINREFVLFESEDLTKIQGAVSLLDDVAVVLPILLFVLLAAAIALSGNRRRTVVRAAIGVAIAAALLLTVFNVLRSVYLDAVTSQTLSRDAAAAAYDQLLEFLRLSTRTTFAVAIVIALGAWLAGPGAMATRIREGVKGLVSGEGAASVEPSSTSRIVTRYKTALRVVVVGAALALLMVLAQVTPLTVLVVAVLVVLGLLLVEFLGRGGDPDPPTPTPAPKAGAGERSGTRST